MPRLTKHGPRQFRQKTTAYPGAMLPSPSSGVKLIGDCSVAVMTFAIYFTLLCSVTVNFLRSMSRRFSRMSAFTSGHKVALRFWSALAARSADEAALLQQTAARMHFRRLVCTNASARQARR